MNRVWAVAAAALLLGAAAATSVTAQESISAGFDTNIAGNDATTVGQIDSCVAPETGATFTIDVFVQNIPAVQEVGGGLSGYSYDVLFDPAIVEITSIDNDFLVTSLPEPIGFGFIDADGFGGSITDPFPATTGNLEVNYGDLSTNDEDGSGVLTRLELLAKAPGETALRLVFLPDHRASPKIFSGPPALPYSIETVYNAVVVVDGTCDAVAPTPYLPPDGGGPGTIDDLDDVPTPAPTDVLATLTPTGSLLGTTGLAIDVLPAGNKANEIDAIEDCAEADVGDVFLVDIVIEDVQDLLAWEIALSYDPAVLSVTSRDVMVFQDANSGSSVIDLSASTPDTSGRYVLGAVDTADPPSADSGSGVLAHVTMKAIGEGTSPITMDKLDLNGDGNADQGVFLRNVAGEIIGDEEGDSLFDGPTDGAEVRVDGDCPDAPDARVQLVSEDGQSEGSASADDDGGTSVLLIIIAVLAAIVVLGGAAALFVRQRSG